MVIHSAKFVMALCDMILTGGLYFGESFYFGGFSFMNIYIYEYYIYTHIPDAPSGIFSYIWHRLMVQ